MQSLKRSSFERHVVLVSPEIHWNTGNIGRTCLGTGTQLHLIQPLGFSLENRFLKRAGLDYWDRVCMGVHDSLDSFGEHYPNKRFVYTSRHATQSLFDFVFCPDDVIVLGRESCGLPGELIEANVDNAITIPVVPGVRSLNIANAAAVILYEAIRQLHLFDD